MKTIDASGNTPECQRCGACCFSGSERHAPVTGDDHARLGDAAEDLVVFLGNRAFMRIVDAGSARGRCAALRIEDGRFACAVYDRRPQVCRDLERGAPACAAERDAKTDRAIALVTRRS